MVSRCGWMMFPLLWACQAYQPGDALLTTEGSYISECVELHVAKYTEEETSEWALVEYRFGNTCRHAVPVNLAAIRVLAQTPTQSIWLQAHDPRNEIRAGMIDGGAYGREVIGYEVPPIFGQATITICVHLDAAAEFRRHPFCFPWSAQTT